MASASEIIAIASEMLAIASPETYAKVAKNIEDSAINNDTISASMGHYKNIKNLTRDSILQYPMLFSNDISQGTMETITKAFENDYANLMRLLIESDKVTTIKTDQLEDGKIKISEFLKHYHTNVYRGSRNLGPMNEEKVISKDFSEIHKRNFDINEMLSSKSLNSYSKPKWFLKELNESVPVQTVNDNSKTKDSEVEKKMYGIDPTVVRGEVYFKFEDETEAFKIDLVFAVKGVAHLLDYNQTKYFLSDPLKSNNKMLQVIRWQSGELKLFRDLILAVDFNRNLAVKTRKEDTWWFEKLSGMAEHAKVRELTRNVYGKSMPSIIPSATMCISTQMVEDIRKETGIDIIKKPRIVNKIISKYFLLSFVIVDETTELVYYYNESNYNFDRYSFSMLKKAGSDSSIKELKDLVEVFKR